MFGLLLAERMFEGDTQVLFIDNSWENYMTIYLLKRKLMKTSHGYGVLTVFEMIAAQQSCSGSTSLAFQQFVSSHV
jgi:hypothetical protein